MAQNLVLRCGLTAAVLLAGRTAAAAPSASRAIELTWEAPADCPLAPEVEAAVGRLVGTGSTSASSPLRVRGRVRRERSDVRVVLDVGEGEDLSERTVVAPSCELATDAAVVVIAMLVPRAAPAPTPAKVVTTRSYDVAPPGPDTIPAAPATERSIWLGLGGFADAGTFRSIAPGVVGSVGWRAPRFYGLRAAFGGSGPPERPFHLWRASARGELWFGETTAVGGAAGLDAGVLHGLEADRPLLAVAGGPLLRRTIADRFALSAGFELVVPLAGPETRLANDREYSPKVIAARTTISVELGF